MRIVCESGSLVPRLHINRSTFESIYSVNLPIRVFSFRQRKHKHIKWFSFDIAYHSSCYSHRWFRASDVTNVSNTFLLKLIQVSALVHYAIWCDISPRDTQKHTHGERTIRLIYTYIFYLFIHFLWRPYCDHRSIGCHSVHNPQWLEQMRCK